MADISAFGRRSVVGRVNQHGELITRSAEEATPATDAAFIPADEKYDVEATIGQGGMGEVMLVSDRDLQRQVAMKVMRESMATDAAHRLRFVAEAQAPPPPRRRPRSRSRRAALPASSHSSARMPVDLTHAPSPGAEGTRIASAGWRREAEGCRAERVATLTARRPSAARTRQNDETLPAK